MITHLRPCPFCGSKHTHGSYETINEWMNYYVIHCDGCGAFVTFYNEEDETIADTERRFNTRAGDDQ